MPTIQEWQNAISRQKDPAKALAELAIKKGWKPTDLWNMYENNKNKFDRQEAQAMYVIVGKACNILHGF